MVDEVAAVSEETQEVPVSVIGDDGNFSENWMELAGVSEDLRGDLTLKSCKNINGMASQLVNAQKMIGKSANMVVVPTEQSTQAEWDEFHAKTGRPDDTSGYEFTHAEEIGEVNAEVETAFKNLAHSEGLRPETVQKLIELDDQRILAMRGQMAKDAETELATCEEQLKTQWGAAYDERKHLANRMIEENTTEDTKQSVLDAIGNSPVVADFLANIAKKFVEHKIISADLTQPTPTDALAAAEELRNTPGYISGELSNTSPSRYKQITKEITTLMQKAYPDKTNQLV